MNPAQLLNPKAYAKEQAKSKKKKAPNYGPQQSKKPTVPQQAMTQPTTYDPRQLLNPKATSTAVTREDEATGDQAAFDNDFGARDLYERHNGVVDRDEAPHVKRKAPANNEDENSGEERKKQKVASQRGAGGLLSDHMKEERAKQAPAATETIDLTNEEDKAADDDLEITKVSRADEEICLGSIKCAANVHQVPYLSTAQNRPFGKEMWPGFKLEYKHQEHQGSNIINLFDRRKLHFAKVEAKAASAICLILKGSTQNKARLKIFMMPRTRGANESPGMRVSMSARIEIILYAPRSKAKSLGSFLSQRQLFLYQPSLETSKEFYNPQAPQSYHPEKATASSRPQMSGPSIQRTAEEIRREASNMFDNLAKAEDLPEMEMNSTIVTSELMSHQKQALHFLTEHERDDSDKGEELPVHSLWKYRAKNNGQPAWYHIVTGTEVVEKPKPTKGGILADVMGLGKTLSILSLIAQTRETSRRFGHQDVPDGVDADINARGTLIICPKSVLSNWTEQIRNHTTNGKMKVYTYHGTSRNQDLGFLAKHDIVLTSYNTAANEAGLGSRKNRALRDINWFRIVLDEAHSIRNQTTQISKGCCALNADRRWAVTGTPVQNTLLDLGALIRFLRIKPMNDPLLWSQHIMAPFKMGDTDVIEKLQVLVGSMTLRRMKSTIDLPDREEVRERLEMSDNEWLLYQQFSKNCRTKFHQVTAGGAALKGKAYAHVLKSLGLLRAICAHGREMITEEDMKVIEGDDPNHAIVLDIGDEQGPPDEFITEKQAYETFYMMQESEVDNCQACSRKLTHRVDPNGVVDSEDTSEDSEDDVENEHDVSRRGDLLGHITSCYHLICPKCTTKHEEEAKEKMSADRWYNCPYCDQYQRFGMYPIKHSLLRRYKEERAGGTKKAQGARWDETTYSGPHTKVKALLEDLHKSAEETQQLPEGEPPIRSVVFSGWTAYLDLIEYALSRNNIGFVRIDGSMSVKQRADSINQFNTIPAITAMLVSIKAGGQGLNLTAANKAYVMEPQFNPGVEQQAVDRIHRIGQTRKVVIKHYIMKDSVEEGILKLQEKKEKLARLSMEKKRSKNEEAKERMEELRALFK